MIGRAYCSAQALCVAFTMLLAACGGGGGGSSGPSLSVSTTNVTFTAIQNGATPATQNVGVSISGGTVYVGTAQNGSAFTHSFTITGATTGNIAVTPAAPTMTAGTYTGTITVRGCLASDCSTGDAAGSPKTINVSYTVQPQTGLAASPQSLSFAQLQGGPAPTAQPVGISELSGGTYAWNATIIYQIGSGWLNINGAPSASGASLPASLSISINPSSTLGARQAVVRVTGNGNTLDVPVTYGVREPGLARNPQQLTFNASSQGATPATQNVTLSTEGSVPINYTAAVVNYSAGASGWLNTPASGTAPGTVSVGVNTTNLALGTYSATLNFTTATQTVPVDVTYTVTTASLTFTSAASQ